MKRVILLSLVAVALASATAYAQMHHGKSQAQPESGMMYEQMKSKMHGKMHGTVPGGQTDEYAAHGSDTGARHGASSGPRGDQGPSSAAFHAINEKVHEGLISPSPEMPIATSRTA
jgi:hypothetical protein